MLSKLMFLVLGGSLGTLGRYFLADWAQMRWGLAFPFGTLLVNLTGCFLIGALLAFFEARYDGLTAMPLSLKLLLFSGFLGAFTTFSSYELEAFLYLRQGSWEKALLYLGSSVVLGLICLWFGVCLVRTVFRII